MKRYINRLMVAGAAILTLASCDDNAWNDDLPGFEESRPQDVQTLTYTLTPADYSLLASNSTNKALAGEADKDALAAVGKQGYFTDVITAQKYIPALLKDPAFPYFTLSDGSSIKVTYNTAQALPAEIEQAVNAGKYTVSEDNYKAVWGSDVDYANSFAPSHTAARELPKILAEQFSGAVSGECVIVNYNNSDTDPVFESVPEEPFELTNVIKTAVKGDNVTINGYVTALSTQGFVLTDASGSIFVYRKTAEPFSDLKIGTEIALNGTVSVNNYGKQIDTGSTYTIKGERKVTYPAATVLTGADLEALKATADAAYQADKNAGKNVVVINPYFVSLSGTLKVSGSNINITVSGATNAMGSVYGASDALKAKLTDGASVTVEGYLVAIAGGRYFNIVVTNLNGEAVVSTAASRAVSRAVTVASTNVNAIYQFDGSKWAPMSNTTVLSHADYQAMGQSYDNLSGESPATYLPIYMKQTYPYALAGDAKFVVYYYYNGSATVTRCDQYEYNGSEWTVNNGVVTETAQFVRTNGSWVYDPSVTITLPSGKSQPLSTLYYQTCVDWVKNNVPDGAAYVTSYGNNEYYCGTSAYQGNVDLRPSAAKAQYPGYDSMTDDQIVSLMKERFESEVMPAALQILHPDAVPVSGVEVLYTINFVWYNGSSHDGTVVYKVTAPATFELVSADWDK